MRRIPEHGLPKDRLFEELTAFARRDLPWREGRTFAYIYDAGPEVEEVAKRAYMQYLTENALDPTVYPSMMLMENELTRMAASHLGGDAKVVGNFTSGGTESCMLAVKTARDWGRAVGNIAEPEIVLPVTAHAAFQKGAHYLGLKKVLAPVDPATFRADPAAIAKAVTPNTVLIVASAVSYAHGVLDPIAEIAAIAKKAGVLFHVDGCIGGFLLPYWKRLGAKLPDFDFRIDGVTSMSMDYHKYAYCPKGASVILHRDKSLRQHQIYTCADWTGYSVINPTILSTRSGGPMAAAWAVVNFLGDDGYMRLVKRIYDATQGIVEGIRGTPGIELLAEPDLNLVAFTSDEFSIFHVVDEMRARRWFVQPQLGFMGSKENVHLSIGQNAVEQVDEFVKDLRASVEAARPKGFSRTAAAVKAQVANLKPSDLGPQTLTHLMQAAGVEDGQLPRSSSELNQILNVLPPALAGAVMTQFMNDRYVWREWR